MRICIGNVQDLICVVTALKADSNFLIGKKLFEALEEESTLAKDLELNFISKYGEISITIVIKFNCFCKAYYRLESVAVGNNLVYGYSKYVDNTKNQVTIDTE